MDRGNMADHGAHVLLVAFAGQGHINPLLRFGKRLLSKGLRATLATTEEAREIMLASNVTIPNSTTTAKAEPEVQLEFFSDGWDLNSYRWDDVDMYMERLESAGPKNLAELLKNLANNGRQVSCIVCNPFVPWVVDVAEEHGIPCGMLWIQSCALYALYFRYYQGLNQFPDPTDPDLVLDLPGLPLLHKEDLPTLILPSSPFKSFPRFLSNLFQKINMVKWVLGNSFYGLERTSIESATSDLQPIKAVGPLVPPALLCQNEEADGVSMDMWKASEECLQWLDTKPSCSVVYVSFGSYLLLSNEQIENLAWGLRDGGRPFLWVVKQSQKESDRKGEELPAGFLEETTGKGLVVDWCPQVKVLSHPSVGCFLTHCGWNSTLETVAAGVPVIAFPKWSDQPTNAKLLVDVFGMGLQLRGDKGDGLVSKEEIERCIAEIMEGPKSEELRIKAGEWKEASRQATMEGGSSDRNIQDFVHDVVGWASESSLSLPM